jgi:hypothetical protein
MTLAIITKSLIHQITIDNKIRGAKIQVLSDNQKENRWFYSVSQGFMFVFR